MKKDEAEIRELIEEWAKGVQCQDIQVAVARHSTDMLMFDVPPPVEVKGLSGYRETWKPFFEHFKRDGIFEIERLDVTAGESVAFATALLRCGTREELRRDSGKPSAPDRRSTQGKWSLDNFPRTSFISTRAIGLMGCTTTRAQHRPSLEW